MVNNRQGASFMIIIYKTGQQSSKRVVLSSTASSDSGTWILMLPYPQMYSSGCMLFVYHWVIQQFQLFIACSQTKQLWNSYQGNSKQNDVRKWDSLLIIQLCVVMDFETSVMNVAQVVLSHHVRTQDCFCNTEYLEENSKSLSCPKIQKWRIH